MKNNTRISIRISQELKARLKALADRLETTITTIATFGIEHEVKRLEKQVNKMEKR